MTTYGCWLPEDIPPCGSQPAGHPGEVAQQPPPETSPTRDRRHHWRGSILSPQSPSQALSPPRAEVSHFLSQTLRLAFCHPGPISREVSVAFFLPCGLEKGLFSDSLKRPTSNCRQTTCLPGLSMPTFLSPSVSSNGPHLTCVILSLTYFRHTKIWKIK